MQGVSGARPGLGVGVAFKNSLTAPHESGRGGEAPSPTQAQVDGVVDSRGNSCPSCLPEVPEVYIPLGPILSKGPDPAPCRALGSALTPWNPSYLSLSPQPPVQHMSSSATSLPFPPVTSLTLNDMVYFFPSYTYNSNTTIHSSNSSVN